MEAIGHSPSCTSVRVSTPDWHTEQRVGIQKVEERQRKIRGRRCDQIAPANSTSRNQVIPGLSREMPVMERKQPRCKQNLSEYWKSMEKLKSWLVVISTSGRGSFRENFSGFSHVLPSWSIISIGTLPFTQDVAISSLRRWLRTSQNAARWGPDGTFGIDVGIPTFNGTMSFTQGSHIGRLTFHLTWGSWEHLSGGAVRDIVLARIDRWKFAGSGGKAAR
jgi:hypothetical protein